ncbi:MAG: PIN domain-containing protein [Chloroflexi bacterium]|nr:PIN domain-containing protein [Chloroflexota bacterium]
MQGRIEPVHAADVESAAELADECGNMAVRDLLHVAVMRRMGSKAIVSADCDFERVTGITRLDPVDLDAWRERIE